MSEHSGPAPGWYVAHSAADRAYWWDGDQWDGRSKAALFRRDRWDGGPGLPAIPGKFRPSWEHAAPRGDGTARSSGVAPAQPVEAGIVTLGRVLIGLAVVVGVAALIAGVMIGGQTGSSHSDVTMGWIVALGGAVQALVMAAVGQLCVEVGRMRQEQKDGQRAESSQVP